MKTKFILFIGLVTSFIALSAFTNTHTQDDGSVAIGDLFLVPNYYDVLDDAKAKVEEVFYLNISMQSPKITEFPTEILAMKNMKMLDLSFNRLAAVPDGLSGLEKLEFINVEGNHYLTSISDDIAKCPSLKTLVVKDHGMSKESIDHLKSILPKTVDFQFNYKQ